MHLHQPCIGKKSNEVGDGTVTVWSSGEQISNLSGEELWMDNGASSGNGALVESNEHSQKTNLQDSTDVLSTAARLKVTVQKRSLYPDITTHMNEVDEIVSRVNQMDTTHFVPRAVKLLGESRKTMG